MSPPAAFPSPSAAPAAADGLVIRLMNEDDSLEELTDLLHRAYARHGNTGFLGTTQDVATTRRRIAGGECYLAFMDGRLVGTQTLHDKGVRGGAPWYDQPGVARMVQLAVDPAYQGRGIAVRLMGHVEELARQRGMFEVALDVPATQTYLIDRYRKRGYRVVDCTWWPNTRYRSILMSLRLREDSAVHVPWPAGVLARRRAQLRQLWGRWRSGR